ncbi:unnamed protein product [Cuscuta epithymum]|uniref:Agamous-like MADS-box protein AGL80 n=1 Tax=Cuscuta epithymum TaxID=186058 RepID=A0AAV0GM42_9ASTE|nr:unnamed protein product [Cuscuta epithymum]
MYNSLEPEPVVWPSAEGVQQTVARFRSLPDVEQTRRSTSQENFVHERIQKLNTTIIKLKKENREKEMTMIMYKILAGEQIDRPLDVADLNDLGWVINLHLAEINNRIATLKMNNTSDVNASTSVGADVPDAMAASRMVNYNQIPENVMDNVVISNPMLPVNSSIVEPLPSVVGRDCEGWTHYMNMMNRKTNNQNDPNQAGPSGSKN